MDGTDFGWLVQHGMLLDKGGHFLQFLAAYSANNAVRRGVLLMKDI